MASAPGELEPEKSAEKKITFTSVRDKLGEVDIENVDEQELQSLLEEAVMAAKVSTEVFEDFRGKLGDLYHRIEDAQKGLGDIEEEIRSITSKVFQKALHANFAKFAAEKGAEVRFQSASLVEVKFHGDRFLCTANDSARITQLKFRGHRINFDTPFSARFFPKIADNLQKAWEKIKAQKVFMPGKHENFTSPDGFRFYAKGYCVSPLDVLKVMHMPEPAEYEKGRQLMVQFRILQQELSRALGGYGNTEATYNFLRYLKNEIPEPPLEMKAVLAEHPELMEKTEQAIALFRGVKDEEKKTAIIYASHDGHRVEDRRSFFWEEGWERFYDSGSGERISSYSMWGSAVQNYSEYHNGEISHKTFYQEKGIVSSEEWYEGGKKQRDIVFHYITGKPLSAQDYQAHTLQIFDKEGKPQCVYEFDPADTDMEEPKKIFMVDSSGGRLSTFEVEREANAELTPAQYLDMLAQRLNTPEKIAVFFEVFMQYVFDSADPESPLAKGTEEEHGEYWQLAEETASRVENGKMLGDCDDYAFLAQAILRRQGKNAIVIFIPKHVECFWVEREGKHVVGYSLGTFKLDRQEGDSVEAVVNALYKKYQYGGLGLKQGTFLTVKDGVAEVAAIGSEHNKRKIFSIPLDAFLDPQLYADFEGGAVEAIESVSLQKNSPEYYLALGDQYFMKENIEKAKEMYRKAIDAGGKEYTRLITLLAKDGHMDEVERLYDESVEKSSEGKVISIVLFQLFIAMAFNKLISLPFNFLKRVFQDAWENGLQDDDSAYGDYFECLASLGYLDEIDEAFKKRLEQEPDNADSSVIHMYVRIMKLLDRDQHCIEILEEFSHVSLGERNVVIVSALEKLKISDEEQYDIIKTQKDE